ncbi:tryptophan-rich sensory protein [Candidatus Woesearchaeota archaeon]|nr:tryptophan-rich sensory protein [Candidatus Woesearchaeota archaeon]
MKKIIKFIISIIITQAAGLIGSFFTIDSVNNWYPELNKPFFTPPNWVFGPVWTILYLLLGISFYLVWKTDKTNKTSAYVLFFIQLFLNVSWSILFFGLRSPFLGLLEIIILIGAIGATIIRFFRTFKLSAYLLVPYFLWVCFAAVLNLSIYLLN